MNKFKLFLILMVATFISVPKVDAVVGVPNINGTEFITAYSGDFADNTNGQLTRIGATFSNTSKNYSSNSQITLTGASTYGANIVFDAVQPFVAGYTYSVSILIGLDPLYTEIYPKASSTRVCIAETGTNAITRYNNPSSFPCTNAYVTNTVGIPANWNITDTDGTTKTFQYGLLTYVFTADFTATSITMSYNSSARITSTHYFGGYIAEVLSDNKTGVSSNEVQSIINNSGLASADSVEEVQQEINNVKEDINNASNEIVNSNKETQDVIKDQTKEQIESQKVCEIIDNNKVIQNGALDNNGDIVTLTDRGVTDYIKVNKNDTLKRIKKNSTSNSNFLCFYNINKEKINCYSQDIYNNNEILYIPENASYVRFTIIKELNEPQFELCKNGNQALNDNINDLNDNITNSDTSSSEGQASSFFENFNTTDNGGISSIVTAPLVAIDKMLSGTCSPLTATYKNKNISLPCGDSFWDDMPEIRNFLNIVLGGFLCYGILSKLYLLIDRLKNPEDDRVDVMKL